MNVFTNFSLRKGGDFSCKYPKHGTLNILKRYAGKVEQFGFGPHGPYAVVRSKDNKVRTLRCDRMIDPVCV
jgi:hypothetical protein